jgi:hypothetical protein
VQDDSAFIQAIIDSTPNTTKTLPAGAYHIATPLRLGSTRTLLVLEQGFPVPPAIGSH